MAKQGLKHEGHGMPFRGICQSTLSRSAMYACSRLCRRDQNNWPLWMKPYRMITDCSSAFSGIATSSQPPDHRAVRASRRGFKSVQFSIAARVLKSGSYLQRYLSSYRLERQVDCISGCQRKSLHSVMLQVGGIRYSPCASASLTLRASKDGQLLRSQSVFQTTAEFYGARDHRYPRRRHDTWPSEPGAGRAEQTRSEAIGNRTNASARHR